MKFIPVLIALAFINLYAQDKDTISVDTIKITADSLFITNTDTLYADTTLTIQQYITPDTLSPLHQKPYYEGSFFISRSTINFLDYRYAGNLLSPFAASVFKDKGFIGQSNELLLYGTSNIGFLTDGLLVNNRLGHHFDLNLIQSESIDSIEILPLPRGFLYGTEMYTASVNFINKDFLTPRPYTRIKYYEAPDGEAFVDAIFSSLLFQRLNFYLDVNNRKYDGVYTNNDYSIWNVKAQLKYLPSNSINIIGSYSMTSSELGLNGGVDVDSISKITNDINSVLYEPLTAPVVSPLLRQEVNQKKFNIRTLASLGNFFTHLDFYYNAEEESYTGNFTNDNIKNYFWGVSLRQSYSPSSLKFEFNSIYEKRDLNYYYLNTDTVLQKQKLDYSIFSVSPLLSIYLLDSTLIPSVFFKYSENLTYNLGAYHGYGADITLKLLNIFKIYLGMSRFDLLNSLATDVYELGITLNHEKLFTDLRLYNRTNYASLFELHLNGLIPQNSFPMVTGDIKGFAISIKYDFGKLGVEGSFTYNSFDEVRNHPKAEVKTHLSGAIFYKDILFSSSLNLKTGFIIKYYKFEPGGLNSALQLDFTVAGRIQDAAIVYFSWENLLGKQYYIVPYYPMRERGIRFGLAWELFN